MSIKVMTPINFNIFFLDFRVKDWPMMSSPLPTIILCLSYAYFCRSLAPRLMQNRKPFDLRKTLVVYNLFQTVFSAWIFYEVCMTHTFPSPILTNYF